MDKFAMVQSAGDYSIENWTSVSMTQLTIPPEYEQLSRITWVAFLHSDYKMILILELENLEVSASCLLPK